MSTSDRKDFSFTEEKHDYSYQIDTQNLRPLKFTIDGTEFLPKNTPRHGNYGNVDIFADAQGKYVVLKTPRKPVADKDQHKEKYQKEVNTLKKIYGNMGLYALHFHEIQGQPGYFSYAMLLPYFPNINLDEGMAQASSEALIINYLLLTAMEIDWIHSEHGIIHNDIKGNNFRLDTVNNKVRGIDFYHSRDKNSQEPIYFDPTQADFIEVYTAPELRQEAKGKHIATPASDMYSFASMLRLFLYDATSWFATEEKSIYTPQSNFYPSFILKFQDKARSAIPSKRPTFKSFFETLQNIASQPLSLKIQYVFSAENFSQLQLKIDDKLYSPSQSFTSEPGKLIECYDTPEGQIRAKYEPLSRRDVNLIDGLALSASVYPEKIEDLNRVHVLTTHPFYRPDKCQHGFFSLDKFWPGISYDEYWKNHLNQKTPLQQLRVILAIARALHQIHEQGYIIGNLKPANIIIDEQNNNEKPQVHFKNLYWSDARDAAYAKTTNCMDSAPHWHPAKRKLSLIRPSRSHDEFSFAYTTANIEFLRPFKDYRIKEIMLIYQSTVNATLPKSHRNSKNLTWLIKKLEAEEPRLIAADAKNKDLSNNAAIMAEKPKTEEKLNVQQRP